MGRYMAYCRSNVAASTLSSTIPNSLLWAYFCFSNTVWQFLLNGSSCSPFGGGQCIKNFFWQTMRRCPSTVMKQIFVIWRQEELEVVLCIFFVQSICHTRWRWGSDFLPLVHCNRCTTSSTLFATFMGTPLSHLACSNTLMDCNVQVLFARHSFQLGIVLLVLFFFFSFLSNDFFCNAFNCNHFRFSSYLSLLTMYFGCFVPFQVAMITRLSLIYEVVIAQEYITPRTGSKDVFLKSLYIACSGFVVRVSVRIVTTFAAKSQRLRPVCPPMRNMTRWAGHIVRLLQFPFKVRTLMRYATRH